MKDNIVKSEDLNQYSTAYENEFKYFDDNIRVLEHFADLMCADLRRTHAASILSLGIGHRVVSQRLNGEFDHFLQKRTVLEGSQEVIDQYLNGATKNEREEIVLTYFEQYETDEKFDALEAGFVLEHVDDPALILRRFKQMLRPGGKMYLAVPNARSLNRLLGHHAGMLEDMYALSPYDLQLGHKRYFDFETFTQLVQDCGLTVERACGLYFKPMTTGQIASLNLPASVFHAFNKVGEEYPDIAYSIYIEAKC